jgi:hypothetical protein
MDFIADLFASLQAHHHQLQVLGSEKYPAEILVLFGFFFDMSKISSHKSLSFFDHFKATTGEINYIHNLGDSRVNECTRGAPTFVDQNQWWAWWNFGALIRILFESQLVRDKLKQD